MRASTQKLSESISLVPEADWATIVPRQAMTAAGWSAATSAWASEPQVVPRFRTWTSPVREAAIARAAALDATSGSDAVVA